jgi:hypothetical protein
MVIITRKKFLDFIYFAGIFLILYWIFVLLFDKAVCNKAKLEWDIDLGISESLLTLTYYLAKPVSFIIASAVSGVIQASYRLERFLWTRTLIFITVFWLIDSVTLVRQSSFWDFYPTKEHALTALLLAIICTILIIRRIAGLCDKMFLKPQVENKENNLIKGHFLCMSHG